MAFNDDPTVDSNSERSEESENMLRLLFNKKTGFIYREETPDYGVDVNIELVDGRGATSKIFPIQIKSTAALTVVTHAGISYISVEFKTSRLGYLCRRTPIFGLITIYDEESNKTYFDYVDDIVTRLIELRDSDEWKQQDSVNILIPLTLLDEKSVQSVHTKMTNRFNDLNSLIQDHGSLYKIPFFDSERKGPSASTLGDVGKAEENLKTLGLQLFNSKAFDLIVHLLSHLNFTTISNSKELSLVAAITYGQVGKSIECEYFIQKAKRYESEYNEDDLLVLRHTEYMHGFRKGNLTLNQLLEKLATLKATAKSEQNILTLEINVLYLKLIATTDYYNIDVHREGIYAIFKKISESSLSITDKDLLKLFNLENLHNYGTSLFLRDAGNYKIQRRLKLNIPMGERLKRVQAITTVITAANAETYKILKESATREDKLVLAYASYYLPRFFFMINFQTMMLAADEKEFTTQQDSNLYKFHLTCCYQAVSLFFELGLLYEVHMSLCCAFDLLALHKIFFNSETGDKTSEQVLSTIRQVEQETGLRRFESTVEKVHLDLSTPGDENSRSWASLPENKIETYAEVVRKAYQIPADRLGNIVKEIDALRIFEIECTNPNLELITERAHLLSPLTAYLHPPKFAIRSKVTGIESPMTTNINNALEQFRAILKSR